MPAAPEPVPEEGGERGPLRGLRSRLGDLRPDENLLLDELTSQLDRTRRLLKGESEEAAAEAIASFSGPREVDARITAELALKQPLSQPDRFDEAHRLVMRALEVLDRDGYRNPRVARLGPLRPILAFGAEFIARYIVKSYAQGIVGSLKNLYTRREAQSVPGSPERRSLRSARMEMERLAPSFGGGGLGAPALLAGGASVPVLASVSQYVGAVDFTSRWVLLGGVAVLFVLFFLVSGMLLAGAAAARSRSQLIMQQPLAALWQVIGHAGNPPEDDSTLFASAAVALTAVLWFVLPAVAVVVYLVL